MLSETGTRCVCFTVAILSGWGGTLIGNTYFIHIDNNNSNNNAKKCLLSVYISRLVIIAISTSNGY